MTTRCSNCNEPMEESSTGFTLTHDHRWHRWCANEECDTPDEAHGFENSDCDCEPRCGAIEENRQEEALECHNE